MTLQLLTVDLLCPRACLHIHAPCIYGDLHTHTHKKTLISSLVDNLSWSLHHCWSCAFKMQGIRKSTVLLVSAIRWSRSAWFRKSSSTCWLFAFGAFICTSEAFNPNLLILMHDGGQITVYWWKFGIWLDLGKNKLRFYGNLGKLGMKIKW